MLLKITFDILFIFTEGQTQQLRHSQSTKTGFITIKKELVEAVRRIAPASIEPSPIIFRDIQMELKTVFNVFF
jgi:hypothetical protein